MGDDNLSGDVIKTGSLVNQENLVYIVALNIWDNFGSQLILPKTAYLGLGYYKW